MEYFVRKYQGLSGIELGTGFTLHGVLIGFFLIPINDPIRTKGEEQQIHNTSNDTISPNLSY